MRLRYLLALLVVLATCACGFFLTRVEPLDFDVSLLFWFRDGTDLRKLAGPAFLSHFWLGLSWLGNTLPRVLIALCVVLVLVVLRRWQTGLFFAWVLLSGLVLSTTIKHWVARPRPQLVPALDDVTSMSFPSGHALNSTLFYLMAFTVFAPFLRQRKWRWSLLAVAFCLSLLTGISRVALGVHYPTDVIAGWVLATAWVWLWLTIARICNHRALSSPGVAHAP